MSWICKNCTGNCFSGDWPVPKECPFGFISHNWVNTDEYELVKKSKKAVHFDVEAHNSESEAQRKLKESIAAYGPNNQTPNCAICRWIKEEPDPNDDSLCPLNYDCMAQGGADALSVYNNEQCQSLFEGKIVVRFHSAEDS